MLWDLLETVMIVFLTPAAHFWVRPPFSSAYVADKNFEDKDSVDGGLSSSSSSSKAPPSGRKTVVSSVRRPSSAATAKTAGEERRRLARRLIGVVAKFSVVFFSKVKKLALAPLMKKISSKPSKMCPQSR